MRVRVLAVSDSGRTRQALARRQGPILPMIRTLIDPVAYCHERAICIDTTAAGGNASLLANAED